MQTPKRSIWFKPTADSAWLAGEGSFDTDARVYTATGIGEDASQSIDWPHRILPRTNDRKPDVRDNYGIEPMILDGRFAMVDRVM